MQMKSDKLQSGFMYYRLMETVEVVRASGKASSMQLQTLHGWLKTLKDVDHVIAGRIDSLLV